MLDNGDYVVHRHLGGWRVKNTGKLGKVKSRLTNDLLDLPQESYLKEWKPNDTIPLAVTNRWELLTYHLNSIAKANRRYEHHSNSYWNNKSQKMRNDKRLYHWTQCFGYDIGHPFEVLWIGRF